MDIPDLDKALKIRFIPIPNGKTSQVANNKSGEMILWKKSALKAYNVGLSVIPDRDAKKDDLSGENDYLTEIEIKIKKKELLDNWDSEIEKGTFGEEEMERHYKIVSGDIDERAKLKRVYETKGEIRNGKIYSASVFGPTIYRT